MRVERAAAYLDIRPTTFLELVKEEQLPQAIRKRDMALWDRLELDAAFEDWKAGAAREDTGNRALRRMRDAFKER